MFPPPLDLTPLDHSPPAVIRFDDLTRSEAPPEIVPVSRPNRVIVFTQPNCPPCILLMRRLEILKREGVTIGPTPDCRVQIIDLTNDPDRWGPRCRIAVTPSIALIKNGRFDRSRSAGDVDSVRTYLRLIE